MWCPAMRGFVEAADGAKRRIELEMVPLLQVVFCRTSELGFELNHMLDKLLYSLVGYSFDQGSRIIFALTIAEQLG